MIIMSYPLSDSRVNVKWFWTDGADYPIPPSSSTPLSTVHTLSDIYSKFKQNNMKKKLLYTRSFNTDNKQAGNSPFPMISSKICLNNFY